MPSRQLTFGSKGGCKAVDRAIVESGITVEYGLLCGNPIFGIDWFLLRTVAGTYLYTQNC
jgi:hypothetical protein